MLSELVRELRDNSQVYLGSLSKPEIQVTHITNHPNSQLARLRVNEKSKDKVLCVKLLHPDVADGRANRADRQYKREQIQTEYNILKKLHRVFMPCPDLGVVKPIACFPEYLALVTEEQSGKKLSSIMRNAKIYSGSYRTLELAQWSFLCGRWLRFFQGVTEEDGHKTYNFNEVFGYCDVRLYRLAYQRPHDFTGSFCGNIRHFLEEQVKLLTQDDLHIVGRHNDFTPGNMLVSDKKLVLLDFAGFSYGPACCDYVRFWSCLDLLKSSPLVLCKTVHKLQEAFVNGYGRVMRPDSPLFLIFRVAYVLDKMDDVWLNLSVLPRTKRSSYKQLYLRFLFLLQDLFHSYA